MKKNPPLTLFFFCIFAANVFAESLAISDEQVNTDAFVVEGQVFHGNENKPRLRTMTVFYGTRAYDRLLGTDKTAVFDFEDRSVSLYDKKRLVRTVLTFQDILLGQAEVNKSCRKRGGLDAFLANPTFVREWEPSKSTVTLRSPMVTYIVEGRQSPSNVVGRFLEFADWSKRLSPYPAQARVELNKELREYHLLVSRVTRIGGPKARELGKVRCERSYRMELAEEDRNLIREAEKCLKEFKRLSVSEYLEVEKSTKLALKK